MVLTVTSLILRSVDLSFQVYLSHKLKAEGMGLYQLIMSIYMLAYIFSTSGIRFATTRLIAEELGASRPAGARRALHNCLAYAAFFGLTAMTLIYGGAEYIGNNWLNDSRTILSLRILAVSLPFIALSSVFSGYLFAVRQAALTSVVQFAEIFARIGITVLILGYYAPMGLELACGAVMLGGWAGELVSLILLALFYSRDRRRRLTRKGQPAVKLLARLLHIALPVACSSYVVGILRTVQQILIPRGLKKSGASNVDALSAFGVIKGMALPLLFFPSVLLDAVADLLVPELAECKASNSLKRLNYMISRVLKLAIIASICISGIFLRYSQELGLLIFNSREAAYYMQTLALLVPFMYIDHIVDNMLKGIDEQVSSMRYNIFTSSMDVILTYLLIPAWGIKGYIFIIYFTRILNFSLSLNRLIRVTQFAVNRKVLGKSIVSIILAIVIADILGKSLLNPGITDNNCLLFLQLGLTLLVYLVFLRLSSGLNQEDLLWIKSLLR